jgi:hypothetical protein
MLAGITATKVKATCPGYRCGHVRELIHQRKPLVGTGGVHGHRGQAWRLRVEEGLSPNASR